ncbi:MAG TPA: TIGR00159 family protein [Ruminiclostridium sp.]|jgi:diadenylate cyclase|uniref:Diadenylate cyclase n=1 Tax=Acetivibrio saccincola TaxID=1677857 RepID=A0A2K9E0D7_9FIRM|nr:diadenylate cyclase CdaA [Acetivibrio saccincola]HAA42561.1 TIGR00159 family protein [Ruminiclostridium sp.]AUG57242.1 DNA integrity scanning protein DisA [Acetivibrio saccincola]NLW26372.1 TIGR00159 family protein [Acetivibrio saccincola]PQQ67219.1 TIGR00159 family protein [Acetivibrio saccincola]HOA97133.1 diadenylate cyclase CdaA [Acetivibrio saccincola]
MNLLNIQNFKEFFDSVILSLLDVKGPWDIVKSLIDIGIVSYVIYKLIKLVRETRAWQLLKGVFVILIAARLSDALGFRTIAFILRIIIQYITIALIVLFQPELRRGLEKIGRSRFRNIFSFEEETDTVKVRALIEEIVKAVTSMAKTYTGALIVIERETKIGDIVNSGIQIDANVTSELLINIFSPNTPLHDGAVVIRERKIKAAACFLPLTENPNISKDLGTRHRAALGITEVSDSIVVVVSEESGKISVALNGGLTRNLTGDSLRKALNKNLLNMEAPNKKLGLWKVKSKNE